MLNLARGAPKSLKRLATTSGVPSSAVKRYGQDLLKAVAAGLEVPGKDLPKIRRSVRPEADLAYDLRLERLKALRNRRAKQTDMEPGLLCPNGTLQSVARTAPETIEQLEAVAEIRRWQISVLGEREIIEAASGPRR